TSTATTAENWPVAGTWWHLLEARHSNITNNYAMQIAGSFFDQDFWVRKTNNSATTAWAKLITTANIGSYGDNLGNHIATTNLNMSNLEIDNTTYYDVLAGNGYGIRFWQSNSYAINMGNAAEFQYGQVTDYSIKMNMSSTAGRGWTWGIDAAVPVASISNTGHMSLAGNLYGDAGDQLYKWRGLYFTWSTSYGTNTQHSIRSTYGDTYGDNITLNSFNHIRFNLDANNNNATSYFELGDNTTATANIIFRIQTGGDIALNGKHAIRSNDSWLRLNQSNAFTSGTYTPYLMRADGGYQVDGNQVIDADAGWHRSYGNKGWYNSTWGGGVWMDQGTYVRVYNGKGFTVPGSVGIGTTAPSTNLDVNGTVRIRGGAPNPGDVLMATSTNGTATWEDVSTRAVGAKTYTITTHSSADDWWNITGYTGWLSVNTGDFIKMEGAFLTGLLGGSGNDDYFWRIFMDGTSGCADVYFNQAGAYRPDESSSNHDNVKYCGYLEYWISTCTGQVRFILQLVNTGNDSYDVRDRVVIATKF
ncbi:hypothetical protein JYU20_04900, partial [Bacteroidales bacterium AH-315-I05]|nr:hypothetical protein [Bacteroidales bacterium AH-315-I05]